MTKIIHITDPHLVAPGEILHGLDPHARLVACIDDILAHHGDAACCIITGDLAHRGESPAYEALRGQIDRLPFPCFPLVGNHDIRARLKTAIPQSLDDGNGFVQGRFDLGDTALLMLDTLDEGRNGGLYCETRQAWLAREIDRLGDRPFHLFMHHPPFDIGIPCLDRIGLSNPEPFERIAAASPNLRHLFFGHVHRPVCGSWRGVPFSTMRGLNHQVPFDLETISPVPKSHEPPAYAVVFLDPHQVTVHFHDYLDTSTLPAADGGKQ